MIECLVIIPARGGSKGIPHKNVQLLAGKPLIAHSIEQARRSRFVNRVITSTDDTKIAGISKQYGAEVIWRPAEISGDTASSESALLHVLEYLKFTEGYEPAITTFLQCTSPLTLAEDIDGTIQALLEKDADSCLAVTPFHYFLWKQDKSGDVVGINHDKHVRPLRQEREPQYLETGAIYVLRTSGFIQAGHRFFGKTAMYVIPPERRLEIDDPVDFEIAEVLIRKQEDQQKDRRLPETISALILDFDGVFTDNHVIVFQDGREAVLCDRSDGWGIGQLKKTDLPILVLSTETNPVVQARCAKLKIPHLQGIQNKWETLEQWLHERSLDPSLVIYVGNDANDLQCMAHVGYPVAVADAYPEVTRQANLVLEHPGGNGAIREICDIILKHLPANRGPE